MIAKTAAACLVALLLAPAAQAQQAEQVQLAMSYFVSSETEVPSAPSTTDSTESAENAEPAEAAPETPAEPQAAEGPQSDEPIEIIEMTLGNPDATVKITEYASFTCGHCGNFHKDQFKKLKAEYIDTGKVHFTYRDVYFDRVGLWASMLARCEAPRFFGVSGLIYDRQDEWLSSKDPVVLSENLRKLGRVAGLSDERIAACMEDGEKARALVEWFEINADNDDITSTPTLIINGTKYSNMPYDELKAIIEKELGA